MSFRNTYITVTLDGNLMYRSFICKRHKSNMESLLFNVVLAFRQNLLLARSTVLIESGTSEKDDRGKFISISLYDTLSSCTILRVTAEKNVDG